MKKFSKCLCVILSSFCFFASSACAAPVEERVGRFLVDEFNPERVSVQATEGGSFMYAHANGIDIEGMRLESISLYALMKSDFPGSDLKDKDKYEIADMIYMSRGELVILEKDVHDYCRKEMEDIKGFRDMKIDFNKDGFKFSGVYTAKFLFTFNFRLSATARVSYDANGLNLTDVKLFINNVQQPDSLSKLLTDKVNPLINPEKIPFPVKVTDIIYKDDRIVFTGHPQELGEGSQIWTYAR